MAATSYFQRRHHTNDTTMRRTAPPAHRKQAVLSGDSDVRHQSAPQPSRLEQMQARYQKNLLLEKERKLVALHQRTADQAPQLIQQVESTNKTPIRSGGKRGVVREFFKERRQLKKERTVDRLLAPGAHLQQLRSEQEALNSQEQIKQEELRHFAMKQRRDKLQGVRAGYSKSKLLDPIKQPSSDRVINPHQLPVEHLEARERGRGYSNQDRHGAPQRKILSNPTTKGPNKSKNVDRRKQPEDSPTSNKGNRAVVTGTPPRKLPKVNSAEKRLSTKETALTDFQKWQLEQDQQRDARLGDYEEKLGKEKEGRPSSGTFYEADVLIVDIQSKKDIKRDATDRKKQEYENIQRKERELEAMIAKHQEELANLQINESDVDDDMEMRHGSVHLLLEEETVRTYQKTDVLRGNTKDRADSSITASRQSYHDENDNKAGEPSEESGRYALDEHEPSRETVIRKGQTKQLVTPEREQVREECNREVDDGTHFYAQAVSNLPEDASYVDLRLCQNCGRKFAADRLSKHAQICQKASKTKRKVFDSTRHRAEGTELAEYVKKGRHLKEPVKKPKSNWKKKHEEFVRAVRDARKVQVHVAKGGKLSDLPPPPPAENADYQQCPYCKRKFNPGAAERHIPHCKTAKSRPKPLPQQRGKRSNLSTSVHKFGGL